MQYPNHFVRGYVARIIRWIKKEPLGRKLLDQKDAELVYIVKNYREAVIIIKKANEAYKQGNKNFCLNYKKYK